MSRRNIAQLSAGCRRVEQVQFRSRWYRILGFDPRARLTLFDASFHYFSGIGPHLDWLDYWVFEGDGDDTCREAVATHFESRSQVLDELRRRLVEVPGDVDFPYWIVDSRRGISDYLVHHEGSRTWEQCQDAIGSLAATRLDSSDQPWQLHVFYQVTGIPGVAVDRTGTVAVLQVSHSLFMGAWLGELSSALFGPSVTALQLPGLPRAASRLSRSALAAYGVLRTPAQLLRFAVRSYSAARLSKADGPVEMQRAMRASTRFNQPSDGGRAVRILTRDISAMRLGDLTVTEFGLAAISYAMQRYLDDYGAQFSGNGTSLDLAATVTVAMPDSSDFMGINNVANATVSLCAEVPAGPARARAIRTDLRRERHALASDVIAAQLKAVGARPRLLNRRDFATYKTQMAANISAGKTACHTVVTSVNCGKSDGLALGGFPLLFCGLTPPLTAEVGVTHAIVGAGPAVSVNVLAAPEAIPNLETYIDYLSEALNDMASYQGSLTS